MLFDTAHKLNPHIKTFLSVNHADHAAGFAAWCGDRGPQVFDQLADLRLNGVADALTLAMREHDKAQGETHEYEVGAVKMWLRAYCDDLLVAIINQTQPTPTRDRMQGTLSRLRIRLNP